MQIDERNLTLEARTALKTFGRAAARYYAAKRKKEFVTWGSEKIVRRRVYPQSVQHDYYDARIALLSIQDPELRGLLDQIDPGKRLDDLEATRFAEGATERYHKSYLEMVRLERELAHFAASLK